MTMAPSKKTVNGRYVTKVPTGITGVDQVLKGGIPKSRTSLCVGSPGSGKTILGTQFLWEGITQFHENAVFVTFEENKERISQNVKSFGWDLKKMETEGKLAFSEFSDSILSVDTLVGRYDLTVMVERIQYAIGKVKAKRVFIDSMSAFFDHLGDKNQTRKLLLNLAQKLNESGVTTLLSTEKYEEYGSVDTFKNEAFVSDCVLILRHILDEEKVRRTIQVLKLRGSDHKQGEFPFTLADEGFVVMPTVGMTLESTSSNVRITSGNKDLDAMCGKGFFRDSIILVSGPTGTGKTLLSTTFMAAACRKKERALLFAFEESKDQLYRNGQSWGMDLAKMEQDGFLKVVCEFPETMGPEDHLLKMRKEIETFKPARIACDSLSAMERVVSVKSFREFVISLTSYIKKKEIAGFFTNTTATLLGGESITETHISTLTDSIILLRYVETGGSMRRGITVVKMRGSWHDKDIKEYEVDNHGLQVKKPFVGIESIMTGAARSVAQMEHRTLSKLLTDR
jgi:circadian clock protein KaiC